MDGGTLMAYEYIDEKPKGRYEFIDEQPTAAPVSRTEKQIGRAHV